MRKNNYKIALIRGSYLNSFELQNYSPLVKSVKIKTFSSLFPIDNNTGIPNYKLLSILDFSKLFPDSPLLPIEKISKYLLNRTLGDQQILFGLEKQLLSFDILHTADPHYYYSFQAAKVKKHFRRKILICSSWETIPYNNETTTAKRRLKNFTKQYTDLFICHTKKAQKALISEGVNKEKTTLLKLGVDIDRFKPAGLRQKKVILFVGRMVPEKGPQLLLNSFRKILSKHPDYHLYMLGTGPLTAKIKKNINNYKLNNKVKITNLKYQNIHTIYQQARIFVLPSYSTPTWEEQYGMVLLEAMACGLPIVSTDCGAIPEVLGQAGIIVPQKNQEAITNALHQLISQTNTSLKLGKIARDRAIRFFNKDKQAVKIRQLYEKLICSNFD